MRRLHLFLIPLFLLALLSGCVVPKATDRTRLKVPRVPASSAPTQKRVQTIQEITSMAEKGDPTAQFDLGMVRLEGTGSLKNTKQGLLWLERSAQNGYPKAQFNMGVIYYQALDGMRKDYGKARAWFEKAAAAGDRLAQFNLGVMYYRAEGVKQNFAKAKDAFERASALGYAEGAYNLGVMYAKGEGMARDTLEAIAWFAIAEAQGSLKATDVKKGLAAKLTDEEKKKAGERSVALAKHIEAMAKDIAEALTPPPASSAPASKAAASVTPSATSQKSEGAQVFDLQR